MGNTMHTNKSNLNNIKENNMDTQELGLSTVEELMAAIKEVMEEFSDAFKKEDISRQVFQNAGKRLKSLSDEAVGMAAIFTGIEATYPETAKKLGMLSFMLTKVEERRLAKMKEDLKKEHNRVFKGKTTDEVRKAQEEARNHVCKAEEKRKEDEAIVVLERLIEILKA